VELLPGVDPSWDAIWASAVAITERGWSAEIRIPYSMLRFEEAPEQAWGVHFARRVPRIGETSEWPLVPRTERVNLLAGYGTLEGLRGVRPRRNVQVSPYALSGMHVYEDPSRPGSGVNDGQIDVGADLKVGLGTSVTLDAAINPDFGQVESDPAVLNLTAFETLVLEKRPFFVEGTQIFQFLVGPGNLLYTRRVGADAPIIGATKVSGRTGRTSFGVLGASTGHDFEPTRHYGVARVSRQFGTHSSAGAMATVASAPEGDGRRNSFAGGSDWDIRFANNQYGLEGFAAATHRVHSTAADQTGFAGNLWLRKRQGAWHGFAGFDFFGPGFNPNDLGQLPINDFFAVLGAINHEFFGGRPFGPFQRVGLQSFWIRDFTISEPLSRGFSLEIDTRAELRGFQEIGVELALQNPFGGYDPYESRGLWPWARPFDVTVGFEYETDGRRAWVLEPAVNFYRQSGGGYGYGAGLEALWNVGSRVSLSGIALGSWNTDVRAWASNEALWMVNGGWSIGRDSGVPLSSDPALFVSFDDGGVLDEHLATVETLADGTYFVPVFGARDTRSLDLTLRGTMTFTPNLSLQLYSQLFLARGRFDDFGILVNPDDLVPLPGFPKRNEFALSSLQSNVVLRWEYRPGSTLFVVWTHGRRADDALNPLAPWGRSPFDDSLRDQLAGTFDRFPDNVFLVKLNYTFLR
ncbi:MAG TPA: DUF5916 domain-containing protein, partial [Rhodothermales bacterium]